jgi:autotransporter-associated beta strand protein
MKALVRLCLFSCFLAFLIPITSLAGSATWRSNPSSGDWNTAVNWIPNTVPNGTSDVATFGASTVTDVSSENTSIYLDSAVFSNGAPPYTITLDVSAIILNGAGIVNNSGLMQSFVMPLEGRLDESLFFYNSATAGDMTNYSTVGGYFSFNDTSSAGSATFELTDASVQAHMYFFDSSSAANATINASTGADVAFLDSATSGNATLNLMTESVVSFEDDASADQTIINCIGGDQYFGAGILFQESTSAGEGVFTITGGSTNGEKGAFIDFNSSATADHATFVIGGGLGAGLTSTTLTFSDTTTAAAAMITATGGKGSSEGGAVLFAKTSTGGTASIKLTGNAELDLSTHKAPGITIGSLAGKGSLFLGANTLTVGSNNQSTTFSGVIQGTGGVTKSGTGTLTLSGNNTYTGPTAVKAGVLVTNNKQGSATGSGSVNVNAGTLAGQGAISGPVIIGTGGGSGAFLAPSAAAKQPVTLGLANTLTFNSDATYICTLQATKKKSANDEVVANGVTINSGAQFNLVARVEGKLKAGTSFTVISNTASTPISGTFANLSDGAILTIGNTKLQASYEGGDGNDLALTVVQ